MEMYKIIESFTSKQDYQCIVMATSYEDPLEDINLINIIEIELRESNISKGKIMFDLLTCFGDNSERFSTLFFDGYKFDLTPTPFMLVAKNEDKPGMIGQIGTLLGASKVNIATMQVSRAEDSAMMFMTVDSNVNKATLDLLRGLEGIIKVDLVRL